MNALVISLLVLCAFTYQRGHLLPPLESLLFTVPLAFRSSPEFLPMITSVPLSAGVLQVSRQLVIFKSLASIQNLDNVDLLCSDKIGALMRVEKSVAASLNAAGQPPSQVMLLAYLHSLFESGVTEPVTEAPVFPRRPGSRVAT